MERRKKARILYVANQKTTAQRYADILGREFEFLHLSNWSELHDALNETVPDVLIADVEMNDIQIQDLRHRTMVGSYTSLMVMTTEQDPEAIVKAESAAADGFCDRERAERELAARVRGILMTKNLADQLQTHTRHLQRANQQLEKLTVTDELTGLYNMRYIQKRLSDEFNRASRYGMKLAVIMVDVDKMKEVNDKHDHLMGSYIINQMGLAIQQSIREVDIAGRYGGDEFIIILPNTSQKGAAIVAQRLHELVTARVFDNGTHSTKITVSQGLAVFDGDSPNCETPAELIRLADRGLYLSKEMGRNRITVYPQGTELTVEKAS